MSDSSRDPNLGRVLEGKYELLERLGAGGMGAVYRARRVLIGDEVAVKVLHGDYLKEASALERFRREARAAALLHHPNVVSIHDYGDARADGAPAFIVMELVSGTSLRHILDAAGTLTQERAVFLMRSVCAGVGAAHRNGVIHRDLKPDNIIVVPADADSENETVKVVDFGIAKLRDAAGGQALTQTGIVIGTPYYMSPEQCRAAQLDARSDVYSLAAMLYEMLAGSPPFTADTATGVVAKHLMEPPPPIPKHLGVSAALEELILRALAKDPAHRPENASTFARDLQTATQAPPPATQSVPRAPTEPFLPRAAPVTQQDYAPYTATPQPPMAAPQYYTPVPQPRSSRSLIIGGSVAAVVFVAAVAWIALLLISSSGPQVSDVSPATDTSIPAVSIDPSATKPSNGSVDYSAGVGALGRAEAMILGGETISLTDLAGIAAADLRVLRNTVYARHGRVFDDVELQALFGGKPWYRPRVDYRDQDLTAVDRGNAALIKSLEDQARTYSSSQLTTEITAVIELWAEGMREHDLDAHMSFYAPVVDRYYKRSSVTPDEIRADKQVAFSRYSAMDIELSNIVVTPGPGPDQVTAVFDKTWEFTGDKTYSGSVQQSLIFVKSDNAWLITSERDLKAYRVDSN